MKRLLFFLTVFFLLVCDAKVTFCTNTTKSDLNFIENKGQWNNNILFQAQLKNGAIFIERNAITFSLNNRSLFDNHNEENDGTGMIKETKVIQNHAFRLRLLNTSYSPSVIQKDGQSFDYNNFYLGNDSRKWVSMAYGHSQITQKNV